MSLNALLQYLINLLDYVLLDARRIELLRTVEQFRVNSPVMPQFNSINLRQGSLHEADKEAIASYPLDLIDPSDPKVLEMENL